MDWVADIRGICSIELMHMIKKRQLGVAVEEASLTAAGRFYALAS
jgi:hypothetical protein